jgi:ketosteroid isomerase-like protein
VPANLELLRERLGRAYEDPDAFYEIIHPDVEWDLRDTSSPMAGVYHGREAVGELYRRWAGAFSDWHYDIERMFDAGEKVVVFLTERGHGRGSGVEVEMPRANVWTFRDGKVVHFRTFSRREDALADAGLPPEAQAAAP